MNKQFKFSSRQHPFAREKYKLFTQIYKKGVGVCFYAHPGTTGLRIASPHRIDNAVSPRQYELYKKVYRNAPRRRLVVICLLWLLTFAKFVVHNDRRSKTSFLYIRPYIIHEWTI